MQLHGSEEKKPCAVRAKPASFPETAFVQLIQSFQLVNGYYIFYLASIASAEFRKHLVGADASLKKRLQFAIDFAETFKTDRSKIQRVTIKLKVIFRKSRDHKHDGLQRIWDQLVIAYKIQKTIDASMQESSERRDKATKFVKLKTVLTPSELRLLKSSDFYQPLARLFKQQRQLVEQYLSYEKSMKQQHLRQIDVHAALMQHLVRESQVFGQLWTVRELQHIEGMSMFDSNSDQIYTVNALGIARFVSMVHALSRGQSSVFYKQDLLLLQVIFSQPFIAKAWQRYNLDRYIKGDTVAPQAIQLLLLYVVTHIGVKELERVPHTLIKSLLVTMLKLHKDKGDNFINNLKSRVGKLTVIDPKGDIIDTLSPQQVSIMLNCMLVSIVEKMPLLDLENEAKNRGVSQDLSFFKKACRGVRRHEAKSAYAPLLVSKGRKVSYEYTAQSLCAEFFSVGLDKFVKNNPFFRKSRLMRAEWALLQLVSKATIYNKQICQKKLTSFFCKKISELKQLQSFCHMARTTSYAPVSNRTGTVVSFPMGEGGQGYEVFPIVDRNGVRISVYVPVGDLIDPTIHVVSKGTNPSDIHTIYRDADPLGAGNSEYKENEGLIREDILKGINSAVGLFKQRNSGVKPNICFSGHSLGGGDVNLNLTLLLIAMAQNKCRKVQDGSRTASDKLLSKEADDFTASFQQMLNTPPTPGAYPAYHKHLKKLKASNMFGKILGFEEVYSEDGRHLGGFEFEPALIDNLDDSIGKVTSYADRGAGWSHWSLDLATCAALYLRKPGSCSIEMNVIHVNNDVLKITGVGRCMLAALMFPKLFRHVKVRQIRADPKHSFVRRNLVPFNIGFAHTVNISMQLEKMSEFVQIMNAGIASPSEREKMLREMSGCLRFGAKPAANRTLTRAFKEALRTAMKAFNSDLGIQKPPAHLSGLDTSEAYHLSSARGRKSSQD